jgi:hypothetical protein
MKEELVRRYRFDYPFRAFSIVEVPAQFFSYPRAWSQAQETVQPAKVFFPEMGWKFDEFDVHSRVRRQKRWARNRGQEITDEEAQIRVFNDAIRIFIRPEGEVRYEDVGRGETNVTRLANPYFQFPQLYNFRYNIHSLEWAVANRIVELYLQDREDNSPWERDVNGISNNEKASLLMEQQSFKELLARRASRPVGQHHQPTRKPSFCPSRDQHWSTRFQRFGFCCATAQHFSQSAIR